MAKNTTTAAAQKPANPAVVAKAIKANGKAQPVKLTPEQEAEASLLRDILAGRTQGEVCRAILAHLANRLAPMKVKDAAVLCRAIIDKSGTTVKVTEGALSMYISDGLGMIAAVKKAGRWQD